MLVISGRIALSDFRKVKLVEQIKPLIPECVGIEARFTHLVNLLPGKELSHDDQKVLGQLLDYGHGVGSSTEIDERDFTPITIVNRISVPRIGTISPWASKATDIAHHCGLTGVHRVERGISWEIYLAQSNPVSDHSADNPETDQQLKGILFDPMTESLLGNADQATALFDRSSPAPLCCIDILGGGIEALSRADQEFGFALSEPEQQYLVEQFSALGRNPTDVELMMFAQVNSEHCRHKIFNADWTVDGEPKEYSLFGMIRTTHANNSAGTLVAYSDNAAVLEGAEAMRFQPSADSARFHYVREPVHFTAKVETHNHPTAISPFAGAATGSGGEIRDEGATGRGGKPKAGLAGFTVSHLRLPEYPKPWEDEESKPTRIASPLQIMLDGPIGAAAFNNEFGRPNICGYFRTFEQSNDASGRSRYGYHKPIMLAGGLGNIRPDHIHKQRIPVGAPIIVLGGPTMLIGLGGGAASSVAAGSSSESLDFASVQRGNPEMQRRCQEVIDSCCAMGAENPIVSIHDVGAGGICNALPELVHDAGRGGEFELREVLNDEPGMSPMQIWCNESQERYVLAIDPARFELFSEICNRERCLYTKVGVATEQTSLKLTDRYFSQPDKSYSPDPIDVSMDLLFGLPPKMQRDVVSGSPQLAHLILDETALPDLFSRVLSFPSVADKTFLVTIGDRSVGGMIARDQMVGPWQVPVADVAVTIASYQGYSGEAMAIGERTPLAVIDAAASGRMAIGEALTNLVSASFNDLGSVRLSANWMVAAGQLGHDADLFRTVQAVAMELCPALGISIPVGKDSMSMQTQWQSDEGDRLSVVSPLSLIVTAFTGVTDVRKTVTPELRLDQGPSDLWLLDLGNGKNRLGGSVLAQVLNQMGNQVPDVDAALLKSFVEFIQKLNHQNLLLAYHDRSDGGLAATLSEMCFTARCAAQVDLESLGSDPMAALFNEELGALVQCRESDRSKIKTIAAEFGLGDIMHRIGQPESGQLVRIVYGQQSLFEGKRVELHRAWSELSWQMQMLRDNPDCALQEYNRLSDLDDPGMHAELSFVPAPAPNALKKPGLKRPRIAILREQGVNGQLEMAAAFDRAGFDAIDVTMSDLAAGQTLEGFRGFAACGGFSFGDVLGAGEGWAKSILFNAHLRTVFTDFFQRSDTFALGVCNGCQMMSTIKQLIPGAAHWPKFVRNQSEQYEARFVTVKIESDQSIMFRGMLGTRVGVSVAHGEGRAWFENQSDLTQLEDGGQVALRFVDNHHISTASYPLNPNGSPQGVTGFTNTDGRFTIMMPHPERVFRSVTHSWHPDQWQEDSPWMQIFYNAREWVEQN